MFDRCRQRTSAAIAIVIVIGAEALTSRALVLAVSRASPSAMKSEINVAIGTTVAAVMLASEVTRVLMTTMIHAASAISAGMVNTGHMATSDPNAVATPLPPPNPRNTEYMCPSSAAMATNIQSHNSPPGSSIGLRPMTSDCRPAMSTGTAPLLMSRKKQRKPEEKEFWHD